ncbi:MAG: hypothetical protein JO295_02820 [Verrucomicrobia bacterium]|nr:hypothetical protein [Verrucomicrobiota bacterium]
MPCRHSLLRCVPLLAGILLLLATAATRAQEPVPPPPPPPPPAETPAAGRQEPVPPPDIGPSELFPSGGPSRRQQTGTSSSTANAASRGNRSGGTSRAARRDRFNEPTLNEAAQDPLELRLAYRRARTAALRDPRFADLQQQANAARSDEEKRAILRVYYEELFARIRRLDHGTPGMNAHVELLARAAQQRYAPQRKLGTESQLANTQTTSTATSRRSQR